MAPQFKTKLKLWWLTSWMNERSRYRMSKVRHGGKLSEQEEELLAMMNLGASKIEVPSSPLPDLLKSSIPPLDAQRVLIEKAIEDARSVIVQLNETLRRMGEVGRTNQTWEVGILSKIHDVEAFIHLQKSILSPLRRLPMEILQEIFLWATLSADCCDSDHHKLYCQCSWILARVCQHWRKIIHLTSSLWTHLPKLTLGNCDIATTIRQLNYAEDFLRCSGQVPLKIIVDLNCELSQYIPHMVIGLLLAQSNRWRSASFITTFRVISRFQDATKGQFAQLEHLELHLSWEPRVRDAEPFNIDTFESTPCLKSVSLSSPHDINIKLPFGQIVEYSQELISPRNMSTLPQILSQSPLQTLTLTGVRDGVQIPSTILQYLVKLHIQFLRDVSGALLDSLTLPCVEEMRIKSSNHSVLRKLAALLSRSAPDSLCPLKRLYLRAEQMSPSDLTNILELSPGLLLLDTSISDSASEITDIYRQYPPLVPHLRECRIFLGWGLSSGISPEIALALNTLGALRCKSDILNVTNDTASPLMDQTRPLERLSVYSYTHKIDGIQAQLEGWNRGTDVICLTIKQANHILGWSQRGPVVTSIRSPSPLGSRELDDINGVLNDLENNEAQLLDPIQIYVEGLHTTLSRLGGRQYPTGSPSADQCMRANAIVSKWNTMFLQHLPDRKWAFDGSHCVTYVSENDDIRKSDNALDIVYGLVHMGSRERRQESWVHTKRGSY